MHRDGNKDNARTQSKQNRSENLKKAADRAPEKTQPDKPAAPEHAPKDPSPDSPAAERSSSTTAGRRPNPQCKQLDELAASEEFQHDLRQIVDLLKEEKRSGLAIGAIAKKWIGDNRYSRILNTSRFAEIFTKETGSDLSGDMVRYYISAHEEDELHQKCGKRFDNLGVGHLAAIAQSRCKSDDERLRLAELANDKKAKVRQIKHIALRVHKEVNRASRLVDVVPLQARVKQMEALDFLHGLDDGSVECGMFDYQWSSVKWGGHAEFPDVHCPPDPVGHLCECLEIVQYKLAEDGLIFVFSSSVGFLDPRIAETCHAVGLKHAGKVIWQKSCGAFMDADTPVAVAHEEVIMLCRQDHIPKSANGYVSSVTPKWAAPTNAHSGKQGEAVHRFQKPVDLMDLLISIATVNGLVVDPFAGSGSAGVAAVRRGCAFVGCDMISEYVEIANRRIALAKGDNEEVVEALDFLCDRASPEEYGVITAALKNSGLGVVRNTLGAES